MGVVKKVATKQTKIILTIEDHTGKNVIRFRSIREADYGIDLLYSRRHNRLDTVD